MDQMVILYYEIHSFRIIDVHGCNDMFPTSQIKLALPKRLTLSSTRRWAERVERIFSNSTYAKKREILIEKRDGAKKARVYARKR